MYPPLGAFLYSTTGTLCEPAPPVLVLAAPRAPSLDKQPSSSESATNVSDLNTFGQRKLFQLQILVQPHLIIPSLAVRPWGPKWVTITPIDQASEMERRANLNNRENERESLAASRRSRAADVARRVVTRHPRHMTQIWPTEQDRYQVTLDWNIERDQWNRWILEK